MTNKSCLGIAAAARPSQHPLYRVDRRSNGRDIVIDSQANLRQIKKNYGRRITILGHVLSQGRQKGIIKEAPPTP